MACLRRFISSLLNSKNISWIENRRPMRSAISFSIKRKRTSRRSPLPLILFSNAYTDPYCALIRHRAFSAHAIHEKQTSAVFLVHACASRRFWRNKQFIRMYANLNKSVLNLTVKPCRALRVAKDIPYRSSGTWFCARKRQNRSISRCIVSLSLTSNSIPFPLLINCL